jgi:hypothetical protein
MKKIIFLAPLLLLTSFNKDDLVEVENFINARSSANFTKNVKNTRTTLSKGTVGKIAEYKKLPTGNYGLKVVVQNGPHKDETYWVYYNVKQPALKLLDKDDKKIDPSPKTIDAKIDQAQAAEAEKVVPAVVDPEAQGFKDALRGIDKINSGAITDDLKAPKKDCAISSSLTDASKEDQFDETTGGAPFRDISTSPLDSKKCITKDDYNVCRDKDNKVVAFTLRNSGPNSINTKSEYYIARDFDFEFPDRARSDMSLTLSDSPDDTTSHATYSVMMFFPRNVLPSIKKVDNNLEVTLPNNEVVKFNAKTKEIIGGAMTEGAMAQDERGRAKPAKVQYTGGGVMIRADKTGDMPIGDIETKDGGHAPSISVAVISKKGQKDCKVPSRELWYTDYEKGGQVFIKKEFTSDIELDKYIKSKCGFGIQN